MAVRRPALLLLALSSLIVANAIGIKQSSPIFVDWLVTDPSITAQTASSDQDSDSETACLQDIALRKCRSCSSADTNQCKQWYIEAKVGCCHSEGEAYDEQSPHPDVFAEVTSIGLCTTSERYFDPPIPYEGTSTKKLGTFTTTCELKDDASSCGSPLCDGMNLVASGDILLYPRVAFMHKPEPLEQDHKCDEVLAPRTAPTPQHAPAGAPAAAESTGPVQTQAYKESTKPKFWVGDGHVLSGTFRVLSRHKKTSYAFGQYQKVRPSSPVDKYDPVTELPGKAYVAKADATALQFFSSVKSS